MPSQKFPFSLSRACRPLFLTVAALVALITPSQAETPLGGLTVAVSPDGKKLVAGGDTRTLVVLDPASLTVLQRIWIGTTITRLAFDKTGQTLVAGDTDGVALIYDTQSWKLKNAVQKRNGAVVSIEAGLIAGVEGSYNAGAIVLTDLATGKEKAKIAVGRDDKFSAIGFDPEGRRLAVLFGPADSKEEPKLNSYQIPKELKGLERDEFQQKNDGQVATLRIYDVAKGTLISEKTLYFSMNATSSMLMFDGDTVVVNNYNNLGARIAPDGAISLFKNENSFNYGIGAAPRQDVMMSGGLRLFSITSTKTMQAFKGEIDKIAGWPEYFKGFSASADGKAIYGATRGYRVISISPEGKVLAAAPVM